jgi:CBS domain containing-hemolysin-like protein
MDLSILLRLLAVLALVAANAFFVATEFALVSARTTRIRELVASGDRLARSVQKAQADLDRAISGTQLGITLASLGLGWIGQPAVVRTIEPLLETLSITSPVALHTVAVALAFGIITYLHIVLGELAPKTVALVRPETVSRFVAPPLNLFNRIVAPGIWLLNGSSSLFLRLVGLGSLTAKGRVHSPEEIEMLVHQSLREGVVEEDEQAMIQGVFELTRTVAREVMTPRPDIVGVPADAAIEDLLAVAAESGFSRLPVYEESIDRIVGVVVIKDLLPWIVDRSRQAASASEMMREALFVPDTKPVDDLLAELRSLKLHMAIVVDEFGGTDGIVTLEDLVEEIVGEIYDEHDVAQADVAVQPDGRIMIDGGYSFSDLLAKFNLTWEEEYDTVAGYVIGTLGRIPSVGERVSLGEAELEVLELKERRITRIELRGVAIVSEGESEGEVPRHE